MVKFIWEASRKVEEVLDEHVELRLADLREQGLRYESRDGGFVVYDDERVAAEREPAPDFHIDNHGSVLILFADSDEAREWVENNIGGEAQSWGRNGTVVEPRYINNIVAGIQGDGLSVAGVEAFEAE